MKYTLLFLIVLMSGCHSAAPYQKDVPKAPRESIRDVQSAVGSVAEAISRSQTRVKYCETCGRRFSPELLRCPLDGTELLYVEP